jgi:hypothetical protein
MATARRTEAGRADYAGLRGAHLRAGENAVEGFLLSASDPLYAPEVPEPQPSLRFTDSLLFSSQNGQPMPGQQPTPEEVVPGWMARVNDRHPDAPLGQHVATTQTLMNQHQSPEGPRSRRPHDPYSNPSPFGNA